MPTVFASVSVTLLLFFAVTIAMAYAHTLSVGMHMLWGFFVAVLIVLLQCLVFGFFIGSGKSIKRGVEENGLSQEWIQKTKDYKNRCYPMLMLAVLVTVAAAAVGGGVSMGSVPSWVHQALVWCAFGMNLYSLWVSLRVVVENVEAIHHINDEARLLRAQGRLPVAAAPEGKKEALPPPKSARSSRFYFFAAAAWVPYLYMKFSLGSRTFPYWPFIIVSGFGLVAGWWSTQKTKNS